MASGVGVSRMRTFWSLLALAGIVWLDSGISAHAQNCLVPPVGLAHWWRAEGNGFDTISVQDAVLLGGVQFGDGKVGSGFFLTGSGDDYIALPQNLFPMPASGESNEAFSFEVWFQTTNSGAILGQQD